MFQDICKGLSSINELIRLHKDEPSSHSMNGSLHISNFCTVELFKNLDNVINVENTLSQIQIF